MAQDLLLRPQAIAYQYDPIPNDHTIRVLTLHPGRPGESLEGELEFADLEDHPSYEAISYTWGDATRSRAIICHGKRLGLTKNQICINQENLPERSQQVKLMNTIYKDASKVLVWLGQDEENIAEKAFDKIRSLGVKFKNEKQLAEFTINQRDKLDTFVHGEWQPLSELYQLPWFQRMWIGQEIGTRAPAELFWGNESIDWKILAKVSVILDRYQHTPLRHRFYIKAACARNLYYKFVDRGSERERSFIYQLEIGRDLEATDPRDHVFALLGHYSALTVPGNMPLLDADYTKSEAEINLEVAVLTIEGSLQILNAVQHGQPIHIEEKNGLPSWVPSWTGSYCHMIGRRESMYWPAGNLQATVKVSKLAKTLEIDGLEIDSIKNLSKVLSKSTFKADILNDGTENITVKSLWSDICGHTNFTTSAPYVTEDSAILAFCQTLAAGAQRGVLKIFSKAEYDKVTRKEWLKHGAAYLTRVFKSTSLVSPDLQEIGIGGDAFLWNSWAYRMCCNRSFFRTAKGYYGIGPGFMEKGDKICVLFGGFTPFCLRKVGEKYVLLGECYVHGLMNGEAIEIMEKGEVEKNTFFIR